MKKYDLLPFEVIQAAACGDSEAMNRIMRHYSGYIAKLCMRRVYDAAGNQHYIVDEVMRSELEAKLTTAVLRFKVACHGRAQQKRLARISGNPVRGHALQSQQRFFGKGRFPCTMGSGDNRPYYALLQL